MKSGDNPGAAIFSPVAVLTLIIVGVFAFAAYVVLSAYAPVLRDGDDGGAHALSKSATGYAALTRLLRERGQPTVIQRSLLNEWTDGIIVYTPPSFATFEALHSLDPYQTTAVILPKWRTGSDPLRKGWVRKRGVIDDKEFTLSVGEREFLINIGRREEQKHIFLKAGDAFGGAVAGGRSTGPLGSIDRLQFFEPDEMIEPILVADENTIVVGKVKDEPIYLISDPDFFNTHGVSDLNRAKLATAFLEHANAGGPIFFDVTLHGIERSRNIIRLALQPPLLAVSICIMFSTIMLALKSSARFGPAHAEAATHEFGKAALADNSAALMRMAGREAEFAPRYAEVIKRLIGRAIGAPRFLSARDLDQFIERVVAAKAEKTSFSALVQKSQSVSNREDLVSVAHQLFKVKKEISSERL